MNVGFALFRFWIQWDSKSILPSNIAAVYNANAVDRYEILKCRF